MAIFATPPLAELGKRGLATEALRHRENGKSKAGVQTNLRASNTETFGPCGDRKGGAEPPHSNHVFS